MGGGQNESNESRGGGEWLEWSACSAKVKSRQLPVDEADKIQNYSFALEEFCTKIYISNSKFTKSLCII